MTEDDRDGVARVNRISAAQGFAEGDPRGGPFSAAQLAGARTFLDAPDRWHSRKAVDLYAVRLQYGRGARRKSVAQMFGIGDTLIGDRRALSGKAKWIPNMSERDRHELARLVWIGGLLREFDTGKAADDAMLASLKAQSEWRRFEADAGPVWLPNDEKGETLPVTGHAEISDDGYNGPDGGQDEHAEFWAKLEAELEAIAASTDDDDGEQEGAEPGGEAPAEDAAVSAEIPACAGAGAGAGEGEAEQDLAPVGA